MGSRREAEDHRAAHVLSKKAGIQVASVYDLVNSRIRQPDVIPILMELLPTLSDPAVREGVIRSLRSKDARGIAGPVLFRELARTEGDYFRWVIAYTLTEVAGEADAPAIIQWLALEPDPSIRGTLAQALGQTRSAEAVPVLVDLLSEAVPAGRASRALIKLGVPPDGPALERIGRQEQEGGTQQRLAAARVLKRFAVVTARTS